MEFIKKNFRILSIILFAVIYFSFFKFADTVINEDTSKVKEKSQEKKVEDIKPADIDATIDFGNSYLNYSFRMENKDSIGDLLEELRAQYGVQYEQEYKTTKTIITEINGVKMNEENVWHVYDEEQQIIDYTKHKLDDNNHYYFKYELK